MALSSSAADAPVLSLEGVKKHFGGVKALEGVELRLPAGRVTALVGENGAGKSTAVKIMTGIYRPDAGRVLVQGRPVELGSTQQAWAHGITAVHQETVMFDELSVAENIFTGHLPRRRTGLIDWAGMRRRATEILRGLESDIEADTPLRTLSVAQKHLVEIARALSHDSRVLIMDEPTAALSTREIEDLFAIVRRLREAGKAILFISHKFDEIFAIADRYAVFRDGTSVGAGEISEVDRDGLVKLMVGRAVTQLFPKAQVEIGDTVLEVKGLSSATEFEDVSFALRRGEVLGFYGLVGAGRTELMEALFGLRPVLRGQVLLDGKAVHLRSPRAAIDLGMVYVPEDRQRHGAILPLSVQHNVTLPSIRRLSRHLFLDDRAELAMTRDVVARLSVKCFGTEQRVSDLSGGNQQKVVIGKWLATRPRIIILDEPTKGIDVGSKAAVHGFIAELVRQGLSVIMVSSELPEVMGMSDRVVVMSKGRMVGQLDRERFSAEAIVTAATGVALDRREVPHA